ncbi:MULTISPECIES: hypothetical protein [Pseudomonas]|uniref:hypothetical protein n=1 Tax=Pseudomonas TaxID=286 RepID=UPI0004EFA6BE|nr:MULTISPECIES: hypothetical protein [Pseudomonas]EKN9656988.1 hypothetical protein [Pseudomonas aeruginosa]EKW9637749.1 hypothetical protein [Pseudomonas aeruginosa]MBF3053482.1 hypothetical protein [Pseudomonas aeruginosa]MBG4032571.1 hypothetical protein [Pseudomonas aeruginosa]MBG4438572.1 hypothetical protein [Pseudomonas aeruginosa]
MSPLIELTKEHLTPLLHKLAVQALKNSPCPFAWMTQDSLWIDDAWLAASLNIKLNHLPQQLKPNDWVNVLVVLGLVSRPQRYVLSYDSKFGGRARWRHLVQVTKDVLPANVAEVAYRWHLHEIEDHPFMEWGVPEDRHATRTPTSLLRLALLLPDPTMLDSHRRPSSILPTPHAVIATYHEARAVESDWAARSDAE